MSCHGTERDRQAEPTQRTLAKTSAGHPAGIATDGSRVYLADTDGFVVLSVRER